jgi:hypothetical protein
MREKKMQDKKLRGGGDIEKNAGVGKLKIAQNARFSKSFDCFYNVFLWRILQLSSCCRVCRVSERVRGSACTIEQCEDP